MTFAPAVSKVNSGGVNGFNDGGGSQMINAQAGFQPRADFRRRNGQGKAFQRAAPEGRRKNGGGATWPRHGDKFRQPGQFSGFAPFVQFCRVIRTDQTEQFRARKIFGEVAQRFNRVGNPAAADLLPIHFAIRFAGQREPEQAQTKVVGGRLAGWLEGGLDRKSVV